MSDIAGRSGAAADATFTKSEMMIVAAARALEGQHVCFVGVGLPNIAVNLAQRTVAPELEIGRDGSLGEVDRDVRQPDADEADALTGELPCRGDDHHLGPREGRHR